jgi:hypothetical protein
MYLAGTSIQNGVIFSVAIKAARGAAGGRDIRLRARRQPR